MTPEQPSRHPRTSRIIEVSIERANQETALQVRVVRTAGPHLRSSRSQRLPQRPWYISGRMLRSYPGAAWLGAFLLCACSLDVPPLAHATSTSSAGTGGAMSSSSLATTSSDASTAANGTGGQGGAETTYAKEVQNDTPLGYFRLSFEDSGLIDSSGHMHDGGSFGGVTNKVAAGALANDDDGALSIGEGGDAGFLDLETQVFDFDDQVTFTYEAWVHLTTLSGSLFSHFFQNQGWSINVTADGHLEMRRGSDGPRSCSGTLEVGGWHHVVITFLAKPAPNTAEGGTLSCFIDGVAAGTDGPTPGQSHPSSTGVHVGSSATWGFLKGEIDEVAIYDYPLPPSRIAVHYAKGIGRQMPFARQRVVGSRRER